MTKITYIYAGDGFNSNSYVGSYRSHGGHCSTSQCQRSRMGSSLFLRPVSSRVYHNHEEVPLMKTRLTIVSLLGISTVCWLSSSWFNLAYDSPGIRGLLFWMCQIIAFPFWAFSELLFALHGGKAFPYHDAMSIALVWLIMGSILITFRLCQTKFLPEQDASSSSV